MPEVPPFGPDVSEFQDPSQTNWVQVRNYGASFAIARAAYGLGHPDKTFPRHSSGIKTAGLVRGSYYYGLPKQGGVEQGNDFVNKLRGIAYDAAPTIEAAMQTHRDLPPALDLEATTRPDEIGSCPDVHQWIHDFADSVERGIGVKPVIYTYYSWWNQYVGNCAKCGEHELWFASYPPHPDPSAKPRLPQPWNWSHPTLWQYRGTSATIPGLPGKNDCSWYFGPPPTTKKKDSDDDMFVFQEPGKSGIYLVIGDDVYHLNTSDEVKAAEAVAPVQNNLPPRILHALAAKAK